MAQELRFTLDGSVYDSVNADAFGLSVSEEPTLGYRYVSYDNDLEFTGAAYAYLNGLITGSCGCDLVDVRVDYKCGGTFKMLCTGFIVLSECIADLDKCRITTKLYDNTFSTLISNNKSIPFSLQSSITKNGDSITPCTQYVVDMFVPSTGTYDTTNFVYGVKAADALAHVISCMTDNRVDVSTPVFDSGTYEWLMLMTGRQILSPQSKVETILSFEQLFLALQKKIDISISTTLQSNGRPLLIIDYTSNINALSVAANLVDVAGVRRSNNTQSMFSVVNFGNDNVYEQWECNGGDNACTFAQTPFYGFRDETFGLIGNCNKDLTLDLVVRDVIFDTNIIEDVFVWGNQNFNDNPIAVMCEETLVPSIVQAKQYDPYNIGQTVYNGVFTNLNVSNNWQGGFPNSLQQYIQGFDPNDTGCIVKFDGTTPETLANQLLVIQSTFRDVLTDTGHGVFFLDSFADPNNHFTIFTYKCPYSGIYTFNTGIIQDVFRDNVSPFNPNGFEWGRLVKMYIVRWNSTDEFVQQLEYTFNASPSTSEAFTEILGAQLVLEQGDKVLVNIAVKKQVGDDTELLQRFLQSATISGVDKESYFSIIGQPFQPGDIQPIDPCDYKRYLYDFEYPLSMADIAAIVQQPSAQIKFSREQTINAGISGVISKMNISSVIRQMANFTIRSQQTL